MTRWIIERCGGDSSKQKSDSRLRTIALKFMIKGDYARPLLVLSPTSTGLTILPPNALLLVTTPTTA